MNEIYLKRMKELLKDKYDLYINSLSKAPYRSIRLNNISYDTFVKNTNMPLEKISYDKDGYYLNNDIKYGNSIYHHLGAFYFQEPSAMMPVNLYDFKGDELVLDLCASPGGKSSQILKRIPNGVLVSNEIDKKRSDILFSNLERMCFKNAVVTNNSPKDLANVFKNTFDVILVDSPCSGEGMMRKEIVACDEWSLENVLLCANRDKEIINYADQMLKENGYLIYSTCTFAREEDCDIVEYIKSLGYETIPANELIVSSTEPGLIENTYRVYPFNKGEGQFMCLLKKVSANNFKNNLKLIKNIKDKDLDIVKKFIKDNLDISFDNIIKIGTRYYMYSLNYDITKLNIKNYGVELGVVEKSRFIPSHHFFKALGLHFKNKLVLDYNDSRINHYLKGEEIIGSINGYGVIIVDGIVLGGFKGSNNHLKNHYPKGLRNMKVEE